jgi:acetyl esterase/lipase
MDPLRDEGLAYAEALKAAGVPVTLKIYPRLPHGFYMIPHLKSWWNISRALLISSRKFKSIGSSL